MSCGEGHGLGKDLELWCTPSAHPPTLLHGFLGVSSAGLACCWCILRLASLPLQLSQMWGSQCSWNACTGVLGGCCIQSPSRGCLRSLQLVVALAMHQPPWHQAVVWSGLAPRLVPPFSGSLHCAAQLPLPRGSPACKWPWAAAVS